jgi:hypothetical protein
MRESWSDPFQAMFDKLANNIRIRSSDEDESDDVIQPQFLPTVLCTLLNLAIQSERQSSAPPSTVVSPSEDSQIGYYGSAFQRASGGKASISNGAPAPKKTVKTMYRSRMSGKLRRIEVADRSLSLARSSPNRIDSSRLKDPVKQDTTTPESSSLTTVSSSTVKKQRSGRRKPSKRRRAEAEGGRASKKMQRKSKRKKSVS